MDEDNNPIIKNTGDINIDTTTYFQEQTQNITQNGDYIYEQNENGAWHLELKPQDSTEPTDVNINVSSTVEFEQSNITNNGYYLMNKNSTTNKYEPVLSTPSDYDINVNILSKINIKYFGTYASFSAGTSPVAISNMNYNDSDSSISVQIPTSSILLEINPEYSNFSGNVIRFRIYRTSSQTSPSLSIGINCYYHIFYGGSDIICYNENQEKIMFLDGVYNTNVNTYFSKSNFNLIFN
jgi:hypothetical protein